VRFRSDERDDSKESFRVGKFGLEYTNLYDKYVIKEDSLSPNRPGNLSFRSPGRSNQDSQDYDPGD